MVDFQLNLFPTSHVVSELFPSHSNIKQVPGRRPSSDEEDPSQDFIHQVFEERKKK